MTDNRRFGCWQLLTYLVSTETFMNVDGSQEKPDNSEQNQAESSPAKEQPPEHCEQPQQTCTKKTKLNKPKDKLNKAKLNKAKTVLDIPGIGVVLSCKLSKVGIKRAITLKNKASKMTKYRFCKWMKCEFGANKRQASKIYDSFNQKGKINNKC